MTIEKFVAKHNEALALIEKRRQPDPENDPEEVHLFVNWLLDPPESAYSFLQKCWAACEDDAVSFAKLLHQLWFAVYGNGSYTVVERFGLVSIVFASQYDPGFKEAVYDGEIHKYMGTIKVLDIKLKDFPATYEQAQKKYLRGSFLRECQKNDVAWCAEIYRAHRLFDEAWVAEAQSGVTK